MISTIGKKLVNLHGLPTCPQIWRSLVQKQPRMVGEFLPTPKFSQWDILPALLHNVTYQTAGKRWHVLCSGTSLQSTTECRVGSRWALPCIYYLL